MPPGIYPGNHRKRELSHNWNGGRNVTSQGYVEIAVESHPRRSYRGYVFEHILVAEKALGHYLPNGSSVHHIDKNKQNNANSNLVICQDEAYHQLLHRRMDALRESGHADYRKCWVCKKWDDPANMRFHKNGRTESFEHHSCANEYQRNRLRRLREINILNGWTPKRNVHSGEKNGMAILTWDKVKDIRCSFKEGLDVKQIAIDYGVSPVTIYCIIKNKTWKIE